MPENNINPGLIDLERALRNVTESANSINSQSSKTKMINMNIKDIINEKVDLSNHIEELPSYMSEAEKENQLNSIVNLTEGGKEKYKNTINIPKLGYFSKTDKRLIKDHFKENKYLILDTCYLQYYFIYYTDYNNGSFTKPTLTYITADRLKGIVVIRKGDEFISITSNVLDNKEFLTDYKEDLYSGQFLEMKNFSPDYKFVKKKRIVGINSERDVFDFLKSVKNKPMTYRATYGKKYQFGVEIETISGIMPRHLEDKLYYSGVHDGSLRDLEDGKTYGKEYVTNILQGDLGLQQLKMLCSELTKRCLINRQCGNHYHLSGVDFTQENIVLMYWLYQIIQDEVYSMLPHSRRDNEYCRKLNKIKIDLNSIKEDRVNIKKYYDEIILQLTKVDKSGININKKKDHPKGFKCAYDHSAARYCWVNFIPAVFNTRNNGVYTIEFRHASASTSFIKVKNWLLICMAFVDIIENHKQWLYESEGKIDIINILNQVYGNNGRELIIWVDKRKKKFLDNGSERVNSEVENQDYMEVDEIQDLSLKNL